MNFWHFVVKRRNNYQNCCLICNSHINCIWKAAEVSDISNRTWHLLGFLHQGVICCQIRMSCQVELDILSCEYTVCSLFMSFTSSTTHCCKSNQQHSEQIGCDVEMTLFPAAGFTYPHCDSYIHLNVSVSVTPVCLDQFPLPPCPLERSRFLI